MGYIEAICISRKKGIVKKPVSNSRFLENWGIEGDAHAGKWHRQISLLSGESIDKMKEKIPSLSQGAFAENIITRGINLLKLKTGDKLILNNKVILEITQIGKECHNSCAIKVRTGDCIMPREGLFARVVKGGSVKSGDSIKVLNSTKVKYLKREELGKLILSSTYFITLFNIFKITFY
jgi:MOSC domain-containing protein YiiM